MHYQKQLIGEQSKKENEFFFKKKYLFDRGISFVLSALVFNIVPTIFEVGLVSGVLVRKKFHNILFIKNIYFSGTNLDLHMERLVIYRHERDQSFFVPGPLCPSRVRRDCLDPYFFPNSVPNPSGSGSRSRCH